MHSFFARCQCQENAPFCSKKAGWLLLEKYRYWFCSNGKENFFFENDIFLRSKDRFISKEAILLFDKHIYQKFILENIDVTYTTIEFV